jgi:hypothetical protein
MNYYAFTNACIPWVLFSLLLGIAAGFFIARLGLFKGARAVSGGCPELKLNKAMRKLWADHVMWTRQYIIDAITDSPAKDMSAKRLLQNQVDIGNAIVPFYGKEAGDALAALLKEHILIAVDVVAAAKANNSEALKIADKKWHDNALEIATFLHNANPENWPLPVMIEMMNDHLALTTQETVARLGGKWDDDVKTFDKVFEQIMKMADELTEGIYQKFVAKK